MLCRCFRAILLTTNNSEKVNRCEQAFILNSIEPAHLLNFGYSPASPYSIQMNEQFHRISDVCKDCPMRQVYAALQNTVCKTSNCLASGVGVQRAKTPGVAS